MAVIDYLSITVTLICLKAATGDVYLHNPRGSNNRLDGTGRNRNNANRMFDSQNNDRGGYNVGSLFYYAGSTLQIEWTNQHSCGNPNGHCELILQYMCGSNVRDGATTTTIPDNRMLCQDYNCNTDLQYGMHEDYNYYMRCKTRSRNKGLFTADQNFPLKSGLTAKYTRQNPAGTRRGYECPEERDYYPYWHSSTWKDIAIMTNNPKRCSFYREESQNVKSRWACVIPMKDVEANLEKGLVIPNNKADCEIFRWPKNDPQGIRGAWTELASHGLPAPDCRETEFSRDNHLGNGIGGNPNVYNWTVPDIPHENCVLRIRYNISTNDYDGWNTDYTSNKNKNIEAKVGLSEKYGFATEQEADDRGYVFENNPAVQIFGDAEFSLQLAINTAQYGRTFQDRSHNFAIRAPPPELQGTSIHNLNVRGKRGNIVQVYPAVEYDFVPNILEMSKGDAVHIQWTGSNTNPDNNDGQGRLGTDRSNIVLLADQNHPEGNQAFSGPGQKYGHYGNNFPMHLKDSNFLGLAREDLDNLALLSANQFRGEMSELDDAGTYFNLDARLLNTTGTYRYMSTRNNNFSNRDQKGKIFVYEHQVRYYAIGSTGGYVTTPGSGVTLTVGPDVFAQLYKLKLEVWTPEQGDKRMQRQDKGISVGDGYGSNFVVLYPEGKLTKDGKTFTMTMDVDFSSVDIYRSNSENFSVWTKVDATFDGGHASLLVDQGGVYIARYNSQVPIAMIVGITAACLVVIVIVGSIIYFKRNPGKCGAVSKSVRYAKRSTQAKV